MLVWPDIFNCYYCQKQYCDEHSLAENHECSKVMAARHIEKAWLRKKGQNITSGHYWVVCKQCGYKSKEAFNVEHAEKFRQLHINMKECKSEMVVLRQDPSEIESEYQQIPQIMNESADWMYECLEDAKSIINQHHQNESEFLSGSKFSLHIQEDRESVYGYIDGTKPHYRIGIHASLSEDKLENRRMVTIVFVHELLHAIHHDWPESKVTYEERILANKAGYFDALHNMEILYLSGRMRLCSKG